MIRSTALLGPHPKFESRLSTIFFIARRLLTGPSGHLVFVLHTSSIRYVNPIRQENRPALGNKNQPKHSRFQFDPFSPIDVEFLQRHLRPLGVCFLN